MNEILKRNKWWELGKYKGNNKKVGIEGYRRNIKMKLSWTEQQKENNMGGNNTTDERRNNMKGNKNNGEEKEF